MTPIEGMTAIGRYGRGLRRPFWPRSCTPLVCFRDDLSAFPLDVDQKTRVPGG